MTIEGQAYLLASDTRGSEWVATYTRDEMLEIFTDAQRAALAAGETVIKGARLSAARYVDMVACARAARD